jgi:hypothetical protein
LQFLEKLFVHWGHVISLVLNVKKLGRR